MLGEYHWLGAVVCVVVCIGYPIYLINKQRSNNKQNK